MEHKINTHLYNTLQRVKTKDLVSELPVYLAVVMWLEELLVLFRIKFLPYNWGRRIQRNNFCVTNTDAIFRAYMGFPSCKDVAYCTSAVHLQKLQVLKETLLIRFSSDVTYKNLVCFHHGAVLVFFFVFLVFLFFFKASYPCPCPCLPVLYYKSLASFSGQRGQNSQVDHLYCAQHYLPWLSKTEGIAWYISKWAPLPHILPASPKTFLTIIFL